MYRVDTLRRYVTVIGLADTLARYIVSMHRNLRRATALVASSVMGVRMSGRKGARELELAVLGLLHESPMHGYELRKRLNIVLGMFRAFSYGSLYPCLKQLLAMGLITEDRPEEPANAPLALQSRRSKIVYKLTAEGKERLQELLTEAGPASWEDEGFGVHFAFFAHTRADIRLRILEGRRSRLEERLESFRAALARTRERVDSYTLELQNHGLESVEREVRWLNELIGRERAEQATTDRARQAAQADQADQTGQAGRADQTGQTGQAAEDRPISEQSEDDR
jgi:DNA-binding PadR family transcriptional regulator